MIPILAILIVATTLAYYAEGKVFVMSRNHIGVIRRSKIRHVDATLFYLLSAILILFVGLRTAHNDTEVYKIGFERLDTGVDAFRNIDWTLAENPGFKTFSIGLKTFVSTDDRVMIFLSSLMTVMLFLLFYRKWTRNFGLTIYLFIASGMLLFTMAALKQVLAMSIGLLGITCFLKNKRKWFVVCVAIATTIHVYIVFYLLANLLSDRLWSKKVMLTIAGAVIAGIFVDAFSSLANSVTQIVGADYEKHGELSGRGVNILRFLVYTVTPVLTWKYRGRVNKSRNRALILFSNFTLIGWCFMFIALFGNANMYARMAMYFDPFMHLTLTAMLVQATPNSNRIITISMCIMGFLLYFLVDLYTKNFSYIWIFG